MTVGIVTGAARGMGAACAARVADMVDVLLLVDRNESSLAAQADILAAAKTRAEVEPFVLDVKDADGIARLAARAAELGPLRAVAHAAGVSPTMADWREIADHQPRRHRAARRRVPRPGVARDGGRLLRVGRRRCSRWGRTTCRPTPCSTTRWPTDFLEKIRDAVGPEIEDPGMAYTWSKRGVHRLVRREAVPFGQVGARICSVTPGIIDTPMGRQEAAARDTNDMLVRTVRHQA